MRSYNTGQVSASRRHVAAIVILLAVGVLGLVFGSPLYGSAGTALPERPQTGQLGGDGPMFMPLVDGYPAPQPTFMPTSTSVPPGGYYPIPDGITYEIVTLETALDSDFLAVLQSELSDQESEALAARVAGLLPVAMGDTCTNGVSQGELMSVLDGLYSSGSDPLVQGYFRRVTETGERSLILMVSGWQGAVAAPRATPDPDHPECSIFPISPAEWIIWSPSGGAWHWEYWRPGDYEGLVRLHSASNTYYVIRPQ